MNITTKMHAIAFEARNEIQVLSHKEMFALRGGTGEGRPNGTGSKESEGTFD